jgi:hypothetical protein
MRLAAFVLLLTAGIARGQSPGDVIRLAAAHAGSLEQARPGGAHGALYISLASVPVKDRADAARDLAARVTAFAVNSLSAKQPVFFAPVVVGGTVAYVDIDYLGIRRKDLDRLGELGSGPAPFPEFYFHKVTEEHYDAVYRTEDTYKDVWYGHWVYGSYGGKTWVRDHQKREKTGTRRVLVAPAGQRLKVSPFRRDLPPDAVVALCKLTGSEYAVFDYYWFLSYALIEPRYHELVGFDGLKSVLELAGFDSDGLDKLRATRLRGAVLFSEVGARNRVLEMGGQPLQYGRGKFRISFDFKTSRGHQDVMDNLLVGNGSGADANEVIWTLANGLDGYEVNDNKGKRLDAADPGIALSSRTRLERKIEDTGHPCMVCHVSENGTIPVLDEVRRQSRPDVALAVDRYRKAHDVSRAEQVQDKYLTVDINELVSEHQVFYARRVIACCGLPPAKVNTLLQTAVWRYIDGRVTLASISNEVGAPPAVVAAAVRWASATRAAHGQPFNTHLVGLAQGRPQRRDQVEAAFGLLAEAVYDYRQGGH